MSVVEPQVMVEIKEEIEEEDRESPEHMEEEYCNEEFEVRLKLIMNSS